MEVSFCDNDTRASSGRGPREGAYGLKQKNLYLGGVPCK